jgi:hypothetical protein
MPGELRFAGHWCLWIFLTCTIFKLWTQARAL